MKPSKDVSVSTETPNHFSPAQIKKFAQEVQVETKKIVWPERKVTMGLTAVVIILSSVASFYLGTVDLVLGKLISLVLH